MSRRFSVVLWFFVAVSCSVAPSAGAQARPEQGEQVWLAVSDIHLNVFDRSLRPSAYGADSNPVLLESAIARMKRAVPNPGVILFPGDFLAHDFVHIAARSGEAPEEAAIRTMRWIAGRFKRAFPRAQFAIALGNNDAPCGDYRSANGAYMAAIARAWSPLVNLGGASPSFRASFVRGGYYVATLPVHGMRLVVLNTVSLSNEYKGSCRGDDMQAGDQELAWLRSMMRATSAGNHNVVMMHIPPGFDAFSTNYTRGWLAWPFLRARYNAGLVDALEDPIDRVSYALAGHTHRFDFRLAGHVPIVVLGSLSPIYGNDTMFYTLRVSADGLLRDIDVYSFDQRVGAWTAPHSFDRTWGTGHIDAGSLAQLHDRLASDPATRARWQYQAEGWPSELVESPGAWGGRPWRVSWCAQTFVVAGFADCAQIGNRAKILGVVLALTAAAVVIFVVLVIIRRR